MEKRHLDRRLEQMRAEGTKFRTSTAIGRDLGAAELRAHYDAVVLAVGATAWRELDVPGRELTGIHQAMEYLPLADRVCEGDLEVSPLSAAGKHVVIVGGGDTGADCLGTAVREGAASVTQLDVSAARSPSATRTSSRGRPTRRSTGSRPRTRRPATWRRRPPQTRTRASSRRPRCHFTGDADGHVRSLHLVEVDERRRPVPGSGRTLPADLVLLALGFSGPDRHDGLIDQLGLVLDARGTITRDTDFARPTFPRCMSPGTRPAGSRSSCGRSPRGGRWRPPWTARWPGHRSCRRRSDRTTAP